MHIFLVRHGEAAAGWPDSDDPGLSERGRQQADATSRLLQERVGADIRLISSPLRRARETAQPLSLALATAVRIVDPFREIPTPVARGERQRWLNSIARQTWSEQVDMVREWRGALLEQLRQIREPAVVFTHFMVLNVIVGALTAEDKVVCYLPANASVTTLQGSGDDLQLLELGRQFKTHVI